MCYPKVRETNYFKEYVVETSVVAERPNRFINKEFTDVLNKNSFIQK